MNEEQFLQDTLKKIRAAIEKLEEKLQIGSHSIGEMQEYFWDSFSEFDEYGYEYSMSQQAMEMEAGSLANLKKTHRQYCKMMDSPYFGRIDFTYEGEEIPETYYIGLGSFTPDKAYLPLIYDWRAPISSLFYDYDAGPATYTAPAGEISGIIEKKYQYKIRKGKLIYALESNLKIDDEILQNELSTNADATLKSIVTTIQKEQNRIIRNDEDEILIVQGSAGSGKTSIALHRIAYLLYHHRQNMKANQILILSPNEIFADYISHILPELGEENILETTLDLLAYKELKHIADTQSRYEYLEQVLNVSNEEAEEAKRSLDAKSNEDFVQNLYTYVLMLEDDLMNLEAFSYGKTYWNIEQMRKLFYEKFARIPLLKRMDAIAEYIVDADDTLQDAGSVRAGADYDMYEDQEGFAYTDQEIGGNSFVVSDPGHAKKLLRKMYRTTNLLSIYNEFLLQEGMEPLPEGIKMLAYEDVFPMMYLKFLLEGTGKYRVMKHLVIDEMQDYTYLQYSILKMMFQCPMTILGDKEQTMEQKADSLLTFLPQIFGKHAKVMVLDKSYRSTMQISTFAARLAGIEDMNCFTRNGEAVGTHVFEKQEDMIRSILAHILKQTESDTHAILCKNMDDAKKICSLIEEKQLLEIEKYPINLLTSESEHFGKGITVMPFYLAKGLEFDNVHVAYADEEHFPGDRFGKILYIMSTRALHSLHFYGVHNIAKSIEKALEEKGE